jgi:hypothetical protein
VIHQEAAAQTCNAVAMRYVCCNCVGIFGLSTGTAAMLLQRMSTSVARPKCGGKTHKTKNFDTDAAASTPCCIFLMISAYRVAASYQSDVAMPAALWGSYQPLLL